MFNLQDRPIRQITIKNQSVLIAFLDKKTSHIPLNQLEYLHVNKDVVEIKLTTGHGFSYSYKGKRQ